ncbi:MAG: nicotinate-nucleotide adenylyltransferase [Rhodobacteraceae bacterium]|nr:nicotinate-nucleotide adenylyltransferase [Paracoccaceae bacterium]
MQKNFPFARPGQTIGLLGGSFDPPHSGHVHITRQAIRRFELDRVWWLVSPGNPLKPEGPAPMARRIGACQALAQHPKVLVTGLEADLGTRYTSETLARLLPLYPGVKFVWLMGADNLVQLHRWENWTSIMDNIPVGVLARPGQVVKAGLSRAARSYARHRLPMGMAPSLAHRPAPCWCLVTGPMVDISSTSIRNSGAWIR